MISFRQHRHYQWCVASVSEALGHSAKAVMLRMYTHADQESISQATQIVREAIKKARQR